jgi:heptosyltransferase III
MEKLAVIFCSHGIGDGLIFLMLSENFNRQGYKVITYHDSLSEMQKWFPHLKIYPYPQKEEISPEFINKFDVIVVNANHLEINKNIRGLAKEIKPDNTFVLYPTTCKGKNLPGDFLFDQSKTMVENLSIFCHNYFNFKDIVKTNGVTIPQTGLVHRKYKNRVVIHPTSNSYARNWKKEKFVALAKLLKDNNFDPVFIIAPHEKEEFWNNVDVTIPTFTSLDAIATFIYESGWMIGNDSGIGHLASCLNIPTLTIFTSKRKYLLWRPDFSQGRGVIPYPFLPNIKGVRMREKIWDKTISVRRVFCNFMKLYKSSSV